MISPVTIGFIAIIVSSAYGMVIECNYRIEIFDLSTIGPIYSCSVFSMSSENPTIVEAIRGNHAEGMNNSDVRGFSVLSCEHLSYCPKTLPKHIGNFFPNLVAFYWSRSYLETITAEALKSMPNITHLEMPFNSLTSLDSDLFQYTRKMYSIDLFSNYIQYVGKDIFIGMDNLTSLRFVNNTCINAHLWYNNEQQRQVTNEQLLLSCPPLTVTSAPTTPIEEQCLARCSLNDEIDELKVQINKLSLLNTELDERLERQHQRIVAVEKQLGMYY